MGGIKGTGKGCSDTKTWTLEGSREGVLLPGCRGEAERGPQPFCSPSPSLSISCSGPQWVAGLGRLGDVGAPPGAQNGKEKGGGSSGEQS